MVKEELFFCGRHSHSAMYKNIPEIIGLHLFHTMHSIFYILLCNYSFQNAERKDRIENLNYTRA